MRFQLVLLLCVPLVLGFGFNVGTPTQCDDLNIQWTGGQAPFQLLMTPELGAPRNFSIPGGGNTFKAQLSFPQGTRFLITMSDATGFGSGGTSNLLTVGASLGGSCNATVTGVDFVFSADSALNQCRTYTFSQYDGARQPITILGLIPAGQVFVLNPPAGSSFDWVANVAGGTSIVFVMFDSLGRKGGSTSVKIVGPSDDSTCLDASSPSSTSSAPSSSSSSTTTSALPSPTSSTAVSGGVIAGTVLGSLILFAALITLGVFFIRKYLRRKRSGWTYDDPYGNRRFSQHNRTDSQVNDPPHQLEQRPNPYPYSYPSDRIGHPDAVSTQFLLSEQHTPTPFVLPPTQGHAPSHSYASSSAEDPYLPYSVPSSSTSGAQRKARASNYTSPRVILHTDVEEIPPDQDDVIELPPQYSANRAPLPSNILPAPPPQQQAPSTFAPRQIVEKPGHDTLH